MILSIRFKESVKTALAMTIAYGAALAMDWDNPSWAGVAVAVISLASVGQSLNKGVLRMLGTLVAVAAALTIIALFPQDRWLFVLLLSIWAGFCTYMMGGGRHEYFWLVSGFVAVIISVQASSNSVDAFDIAILRAQETGLGILVYSLVAVLLWPSNSRAGFNHSAQSLASTQHRLYKTYLRLMNGEGNAAEAQPLKTEAVREQTRFSQLLAAAETDSYQIWELRRQWRRYQRQAVDLAETLERWRESSSDVRDLDLQLLLPNLAAFDAEIDGRFAQLERMLANQAPEQRPRVMDLTLNETEARTLSHFHQAALAVNCSRLQHLERLTFSLFDSLSDIKGYGQPIAVTEPPSSATSGALLDPDRLASVVRIMVIVWLSFLGVVYVTDIPGGVGIMNFSIPFGMIMATSPQMPVKTLFVPPFVSILAAGILYIFVMPQLSSFFGLGPMLFMVTFAICYLFAAPKQALGRVFGLVMFVVVTSIDNQQTYSFLTMANTALMFPLVFLILMVSAYFPFDLRSESTFLRLLRRFFRSGDYLMSTMRWDPQRSQTRPDRRRKAFHKHQLESLPQKLGAWAPYIDAKVLSGTSPDQIQALVTAVQSLTYRMQELLEARANPHAEFIIQEMLQDVRAWRLRVQEVLQRLSKNPAGGDTERGRTVLNEIVEHLEARVEETLNKATDEQLSIQEREHFYRLLGAFRGLSETIINYAASTAPIDWDRWREARF